MQNGPRSAVPFLVPLLCLLVGLVLLLTLHPATLAYFLGVALVTAGLVVGLRRARGSARLR